MSPDPINIVIGGEAGQGLITIGQLLTKSLVRSGYEVGVTQDYQSRIRGGHNTFRVRASTESLAAPQEAVDLLVALDSASVDLHRPELSPRGIILIDDDLSAPEDCCRKVPLKELAPDRFANITALGVVSTLLGLREEIVLQATADFFGHKSPQAAEGNRQALQAAFTWAKQQSISFPALPESNRSASKLILTGNEAVALGALSAGLKFFAFYPMSPSTSIGLTLAAQAKKMGLVVEQAEDEIAAINLALGASFAGAPSMVATSGGGFALMAEGVSLAGMTETPIVIVVAQRPGPATGLPTRTEQGDLEFVLHSGHGEFPRAVFTPGSVEECFHLTRKALKLAEQSQGPVFILTDQFLADSYRAVDPWDLSRLPPLLPRNAPAISEPYLRYALTENGVSPRLFPGLSDHLVVADSDEHTEDGHLTEDLIVRKSMVEKRGRKLKVLQEAAVPPEFMGEPRPDLLLVTWGSSRGAVQEAVSLLKLRGKRTAMLHFSQVWPLVPDQFLSTFREAGEIVAVEMNATGQFGRLLRRETGVYIEKTILRYDGSPLTPEYLLRELERRQWLT
jgi:2-oxoglutarate/2-oxoacid ferredoxin oxidoreductase subunit alpha